MLLWLGKAFYNLTLPYYGPFTRKNINNKSAEAGQDTLNKTFFPNLRC